MVTYVYAILRNFSHCRLMGPDIKSDNASHFLVRLDPLNSFALTRWPTTKDQDREPASYNNHRPIKEAYGSSTEHKPHIDAGCSYFTIQD